MPSFAQRERKHREFGLDGNAGRVGKLGAKKGTGKFSALGDGGAYELPQSFRRKDTVRKFCLLSLLGTTIEISKLNGSLKLLLRERVRWASVLVVDEL